MSTDANKLVIQYLIEQVWRQGNLDALHHFWTDDCLNHADPSDENRGLHALRQYHEGFGPWFETFNDITINILMQIAENDMVTTHIRLHARHNSTGRAVHFDTIRIDKIREGKISEHWSVADMARLNAQIA